ncbi:hypothetical protein BN1723_006539 [Verticillium longisporum]|uniref:Zn(2)-C6 fungal-type domain-containing protein n=1 Tax=Verticillium longisporum TaxID=100787 RepID=A0A0G4NFR3_VERLO|nr:hypothetical protein BN1708_009735 [Verticillium longisporum]CRK45312.1 hypothetical protein BN1723_006539 [Verticillium longisporum]
MGVSTVHPSQKRISCEVCRKHKAQRLSSSDAKCSRCTLLGVECVTGQQKKIGRPRRRPVVAGAETPQTRQSENTNTSPVHHQATLNREYSGHHSSSPNSSPGPVTLQGNHQLGWNLGNLSPSTTSTPLTQTPVVDNGALGTAIWPSFDVESYDQNTFAGSTIDHYGDGPYMFEPSLDFDLSSQAPYTEQAPMAMPSPPEELCETTKLTMTKPVLDHGKVDDIAVSEAISKLSKMNLDLHIRVAAAEMHKSNINFNRIIYDDSPLFIDNTTLADFILKASQEIHLIMTRLRGNRTTRGMLGGFTNADKILASILPPSPQSSQGEVYATSVTPSHPYPAAAGEPLLAPLALTLTSIYTQLITLFELILEHLSSRIQRIGSDPIAPINGLTVGGLPLVKPCVQGMMFAEVIIQILVKFEQALGIVPSPEGSGTGLLSARQISVLWSELDEGPGIMPGQGMLRPARLKKSFERVAAIFKHLSIEL